MRYYSLNRQSPDVDFKEATIRGQAPDKGLYFPEQIPVIDPAFFKNIDQFSNEEIAFRFINPYVAGAMPDDELQRIVAETINFHIPLVQVKDDTYSLELFHGPTLAFKDVGARFMSRCLGYFARERSERVVVLVATSGDTGGAVAHGFYNVPGVEVVILYPSGKVSSVQEKQLTTLGKNIHALEVKGSFDDCQQMVKQAFVDESLTSRIFLTSANSINVARWLPQQFYYALAWKQWKDKENPPVICVPSGNFGNICAGLLAHRSGLPVSHFVAACNVNDVVTQYLHSGQYQAQKAVPTLSNAMDVGNPSNFVRILELFNHEFGNLTNVLSSFSISDEETRTTIKEVYDRYRYLADPHGAVGYLGLQRYLDSHPGQKGMFLETAHPVKFYDVVEPVIGAPVPLPEAVQAIVHKVKQSRIIESDYEALRAYLQERY
ncbi:threonine synthase [Paraflavitalea sp. CAU 1676]|uniref:threonine synthase n=1 Tax=Paraflavitalea sp. CAU 1676 TaxID=3032598 RepID=UPI0023DAA54B|nr:threonine synthase [Paraflavitalea sp. CAU 1676]MDF2192199.1 threonine synthase [Paraflavitalea sp. CAU 1676]